MLPINIFVEHFTDKGYKDLGFGLAGTECSHLESFGFWTFLDQTHTDFKNNTMKMVMKNY